MKCARNYNIEFWVDSAKVPFSTQFKKKIIDFLFNDFQGMFTPERYNTFEPFNRTFVNQDELLKMWNIDDFFFSLKKISSPKFNFFCYRDTSKI